MRRGGRGRGPGCWYVEASPPRSTTGRSPRPSRRAHPRLPRVRCRRKMSAHDQLSLAIVQGACPWWGYDADFTVWFAPLGSARACPTTTPSGARSCACAALRSRHAAGCASTTCRPPQRPQSRRPRVWTSTGRHASARSAPQSNHSSCGSKRGRTTLSTRSLPTARWRTPGSTSTVVIGRSGTGSPSSSRCPSPSSTM